MKGYIITYREGLTGNDITRINYYLFGRIVQRQTQPQIKERYYYSGLFEHTPYVRLANGCYFTERIVDDYDGRLLIFKSEIEIPNNMFQTARAYWKKFITEKQYRVKNF